MQYKWIRSFHWTAHYGSVFAASQYLNIVPSTISTQIKELEAYYNIQLFSRKANAIELTPIGRSLKKKTDPLFSAEKNITKLLKKAKNRRTKTFNLGVEGISQVLPVIDSLNKVSDKYLVRFFDSNHAHLVEMLAAGKIDILIAHRSDDDAYLNDNNQLSRIWLGKSKLFLLKSPDKKTPRNSLDLNGLKEMLAQYPVVSRTKGSLTRILQDQIHHRLGLDTNILAEVSSREAFIRMIAANQGIGFLLATDSPEIDGLERIDCTAYDDLADLATVDNFLYCTPDLSDHVIIKILCRILTGSSTTPLNTTRDQQTASATSLASVQS